MLSIEFTQHDWGVPRIEPFKPLSLPPYSACLHYGLECFEGMKAYSDMVDIQKVSQGETLGPHRRLRLFRPQKNLSRLQESMRRLCFPSFDTDELLKLLETFVRIEKDYVPMTKDYSLYIRPTVIGIGNCIGATAAESGMLFIIASPVGSYFSKPTDGSEEVSLPPVRLLVDETNRRAWPGGIGGYKLGANYAGPMLIQREAVKKGFKQVLWLGPNNEVTEVGAMNFMMLWRSPEGKVELITAPLDGMILPGITRDSVLTLMRQWGEVDVAERYFTIDEMITAIEEGRVLECFGSGTAAVLAPVNMLRYRDKDYLIPCPTGKDSLCLRLYKSIIDIQYGKLPSEWSYIIDT
ncbi:unnamed protein product [Phytomonas sp. Hart1]|nr:unnamed protein product [Phytomonas sp. Hart1]|eukprot:CCW70483.1 unnamed protein product [Phytomonas sp. isolate Hart1]